MLLRPQRAAAPQVAQRSEDEEGLQGFGALGFGSLGLGFRV